MTLQDPITRFVPNLNKNPYSNVNIQELLCHVSGLPFHLTSARTTAIFINVLNNIKPTFTPNKQYQYTNAGASLVGLALENIYKTSYEAILTKQLLNKLHMPFTYINVPPLLKTLMAAPYNSEGKETTYPEFGAMAPGGSIKSNTQELVKYLQLQINGSNDFILDNALKLVHSNYYYLDNDIAQQLSWECHPIQSLGEKPYFDLNTIRPPL